MASKLAALSWIGRHPMDLINTVNECKGCQKAEECKNNSTIFQECITTKLNAVYPGLSSFLPKEWQKAIDEKPIEIESVEVK